jgi:hypothetical protein
MTKNNETGIVTAISGVFLGAYTLASVDQKNNYTYVTTGRRQYLVSPYFTMDDTLTPYEARVTQYEENCTLFYRISLDKYAFANNGAIGCEVGASKKKVMMRGKAGQSFEMSSKDSCYSACLTSGLKKFPIQERHLDPIPAFHPGLMRPIQLKRDYQVGGREASFAKVDRKLQLMLEAGMRQAEELAQDNMEYTTSAVYTWGGLIGIVLTVVGISGGVALSCYLIKRKRNRGKLTIAGNGSYTL